MRGSQSLAEQPVDGGKNLLRDQRKDEDDQYV
jgi:hypothetical protein